MNTIIFDFDGTIADSKRVFRDGWNKYAPQYRYDQVDLHHIAETNHMTLQQRAKHFHFPMHKLPIILPKIYRYFQEHVHEIQIFDGIQDMLTKLKEQGYQVCILSSNAVENIEAVLRHNEVTAVDHIFSSGKLFGKDMALKKIMKAHKLVSADILYIGDEFRDLEACRKVGIDFGWVSWGLDGADLIETLHPVYRFDQPEEIADTLCK